jgi:type IV pilus assembly protein PilM
MASPVSERKLGKDLLVPHLKKVAQEMGNRGKSVVYTLGVADSMLRQTEMPLLPLEDIRSMINLAPKQYLQADMSDHVFDCALLAGSPLETFKPDAGKGPAKVRVLVGGAKRQMVQDVQSLVKESGLAIDQIVPSLIGPVNALEHAQPEAFAKESIALVDLGFLQTTICIVDRGELKLNRTVDIGGDKVTSGIAESMSITYAEAEGIKIGMPQDVEAQLTAHLSPLGRELRASIDFFEHQQDRTVSQVFLCGAAASSETFTQLLQNEMMVPCKSWNPAAVFELSLVPEKMNEIEQVAPQLAVSIGAAIAAL